MTTITAEALKSMSAAEMLALVNTLAAERDAAKAAQSNTLRCKVSEKGALSLIGLGRFPVTLYVGQWDRLVKFIPELVRFIDAHRAEFSTKPVKAG